MLLAETGMDEGFSKEPPQYPDETLPIRWLTDFVIMEASTGVFLSPFLLEDASHDKPAIACGSVRAVLADEDCADDDDEDDELDGGLRRRIHLTTSVIFYTAVYEDPYIWLRTQFAWYKLDVPRRDYLHLYVSDWTVQYITSAVLSIIAADASPASPNINSIEGLALFIGPTSPETKHDASAQRILGRSLTQEDIEMHVSVLLLAHNSYWQCIEMLKCHVLYYSPC